MITELLDTDLEPEPILDTLNKNNMTSEVNTLCNLLDTRIKTLGIQHYKAQALNSTNPYTRTLTLYYNAAGNISIKAPDSTTASPYFYSVPGKTFLFSINNTPFNVQRYTIEDDQLSLGDNTTVDDGQALYIDGTKELFECDQEVLSASINLIDRRADIAVFDRRTLKKVAWLPNDESAARFLVSLELLEAAADPHARKVAEELIYHQHPAVTWKAFNVIAQEDKAAALAYAPVMRLLQNEQLNRYLDAHMDSAP